MNPLLQTHFDNALEHPNGIKKLRELILTLAMQGKLVEQDPNDQPASELLKEIQAEKARLVAEGKVKKSETLPAVKEEEMPFVIPKGWEWVRVGEVLEYLQRGKSPKYSEEPKIPVIAQKCIQWNGFRSELIKYIEPDSLKSYSADRYVRNNDVLINSTGTGTLGRIHLYQNDLNFEIVVCDSHVTIVRSIKIHTTYLYKYFCTREIQNRFESNASGSTNQIELNISTIALTPLPLPPLAEQKRIVDKIGELFLLCDELETLKKSKDTKRKDLHQSVITQMLEADSQESFQKHFQFLTTHFQELYSVKENVKELRKAVLQLAVMGKLVPQDPNDQPASELLKEIQAEKARLLAEGKIKKSEALPVVKEEEKPFVIPKGWEWVRLGEVLQKFGAGSTPLGGKSVYTTDGIMFLRSQNVWNDGLYLDDVARISKSIHEKMKGTKVIGNDILLNITGASIGRSTIFPLNFEEANVSQHVAILRTFTPSIVTYLHKLIISDFFQNLVFKEQVGVSREGLSMTKLSKFPLPLPPLAEQKRIVEKVDEFLALCDELEERIGKAEEKRGEILKGMVRV
ncbi:restriction endonuclease subunit S [Leptospira kanakyensis]|uniref:Restriction endonuclease subunit S n=1 Tax=Leptospira kanakyensis TaxID=2484968 RepID=A0A6N4Q7T7_9LEPT|nr:restriction endonuclease subunit S [Leptospira kanakyensis]TGK49184.1 restriction endonuclease subunit S [Leptospira kanakyensis]TGK60574.1 restriction endonuclease subunit S [Leptospira kanakyensis]TGK67975.1 restriction endonuclease subunit S [Leptospira kanakyensis]